MRDTEKKIWKSLIGKLVWIVGAFVVFFFIGDSLGIIPQSAKDTVAWLGENAVWLAFVLCFLVGCYTVLKLKGKKEGE